MNLSLQLPVNDGDDVSMHHSIRKGNLVACILFNILGAISFGDHTVHWFKSYLCLSFKRENQLNNYFANTCNCSADNKLVFTLVRTKLRQYFFGLKRNLKWLTNKILLATVAILRKISILKYSSQNYKEKMLNLISLISF